MNRGAGTDGVSKAAAGVLLLRERVWPTLS